MRYWITTHWPRRKDKPADEPREVEVQDKKRHVIARVRPGDLVFIYESRTGPIAVSNRADGSTDRIPRWPGREGIVELVRVTELAHEKEGSEPDHYANGTTLWWRYHAPTTSVNSKGFIPRAQAAGLLDYSKNYVFHGFGNDHSGLGEISEEQFNKLLAAFVNSRQRDEQEHVSRAPSPRFGAGGEGAEHRALKERIASDPAGVLGEPGLTLWRKEWALPTCDKIDLVLKDRYGRFVAVEVEVHCDASELAGPLQCMKYRAMLSYFFETPSKEVRCILVAHSIHQKVLRRCRPYSIETKVVGL